MSEVNQLDLRTNPCYDIAGNRLAIGDVVVMSSGYKSSGLVIGTIIRFGPRKVVVSTDIMRTSTYQHTALAYPEMVSKIDLPPGFPDNTRYEPRNPNR